MLSQYSVKR